MKSRLYAAALAATLAAVLCGCTMQYTDGKTDISSDTLRPGGPPPEVGAQPGGPATGAATRITNPNAPKASNGGTGTEQNVNHATPSPGQAR